MIDSRNITRDDKYRIALLSDFYLFTRVFFKLRTNRDWQVSTPIGRESHFITITNAFTRVFYHQVTNLQIWCPPRYGKSEICANFIAWALARYPDSNFLYISMSKELATDHTSTVRDIIMLPEYQELFDTRISSSTKSKDDFKTIQGGRVYAAGIGGTITGKGAGIQGSERFGGALIIDDSIKPDEAPSDTIRNRVNGFYLNTLESRRNDPRTPFVHIGQRVHEDDLAANLDKQYDGHVWEKVCLPGLDAAGNALYPQKHSVEQLRNMQKHMPYIFSAQIQQDPLPAGGALFNPDWFVMMDNEPEMLTTFITADTAETEQTFNDATVFSFWGIYKIKQGDIETDDIGLHWIDCVETWVQPKDLENEFDSFYMGCLRHSTQPKYAYIEKKSTGVTLVSMIKDKYRMLQIREIERTRAAGSKASRFINTQFALSSRLVSLSVNAKHVSLVKLHMSKITPNMTHRFDDIADTYADAVKLAIIDKVIPYSRGVQTRRDDLVKSMADKYRANQNARKRLYDSHSRQRFTHIAG